LAIRVFGAAKSTPDAPRERPAAQEHGVGGRLVGAQVRAKAMMYFNGTATP
jgi:hypothetical protein